MKVVESPPEGPPVLLALGEEQPHFEEVVEDGLDPLFDSDILSIHACNCRMVLTKACVSFFFRCYSSGNKR